MFTLGRKVPFGQLPVNIRVIACSLHLLPSQENGVSKTSIKILFVLIVGLAGLLLAGCPPRESIAKINQDPGRFAGKEISIAGQVTDSFGAAGTGVFQLDDGTGTMWVFSKNYGVPGSGAKLAVTGRIQQGFAFGGRNFATILFETERRH
jgi:hypothetical protein